MEGEEIDGKGEGRRGMRGGGGGGGGSAHRQLAEEAGRGRAARPAGGGRR